MAWGAAVHFIDEPDASGLTLPTIGARRQASAGHEVATAVSLTAPGVAPSFIDELTRADQ
jgi:hypothetical protein